MTKTPIEWSDFTVNPFRFRNLKTGKVGHHCAKISPGCKNCYSSAMQAGPYLSGLTFIEENKPKGKFFLEERALEQVLHRRKPVRIFWCDMTDMFLADYPDEWIDRCFAVMALTPQHTHQVLTKRAARMREYFARDAHARWWSIESIANELATKYHLRHCDRDGVLLVKFPSETMERPLPNVWLGVSVEDQQRADERIPLLLRTPAAVRFISAEPLLGLVDLTRINYTAALRVLTGAWFDGWDSGDDGTQLAWVIVGGESGPDARPFDLAWARAIVAQCKAAGVSCFVKQLGARPFAMVQPTGFEAPYRVEPEFADRKGGDPSEWPADLRVREMPEVRRG
jgi:protein gp37